MSKDGRWTPPWDQEPEVVYPYPPKPDGVPWDTDPLLVNSPLLKGTR